MVDTEFVRFKIFNMPCCGQQLCWVGTRLPTYCPECGTSVFVRLKFEPEKHIAYQDDEARLLHKRIKA